MSVTITTSGGDTTYEHAVTQSNRVELDKRMYRSPFGTTWRTEGSGDSLPERVGVTIEVWGGTAESDANDVITTADAATRVETPYWQADVEGVTFASVVPVANGYRVRVEWLTQQPSEAIVSTAAGDGPDGTQNYVAVTIQASQVPTALTDFPVYVDMSDLPAAFWSGVQADGGDIRVTEDDGTTRAPVDLVSIDTGGSTGELHFKASSVSASSNTTYRVYYNASTTLSQPAVGDTYGRNAAWADYGGVWHGDDLVDVTGNGNTLTAVGNAATGHTTNSKIGDAFDLDGTGDYLTAEDSASLSVTGDLTLSTWMRETTGGSPNRRVLNKYDTNAQRSYTMWIHQDNEMRLGYSSDGSANTNSERETTGSFGTDSTWRLAHVMADVSAQDIDMYVNGSASATTVETTAASTSIYDGTAKFSIGDILTSGVGFEQEFAGQIDEVRVRAGLLSADWIASEFTNQNDPITFYSIGTEQAA